MQKKKQMPLGNYHCSCGRLATPESPTLRCKRCHGLTVPHTCAHCNIAHCSECGMPYGD